MISGESAASEWLYAYLRTEMWRHQRQSVKERILREWDWAATPLYDGVGQLQINQANQQEFAVHSLGVDTCQQDDLTAIQANKKKWEDSFDSLWDVIDGPPENIHLLMGLGANEEPQPPQTLTASLWGRVWDLTGLHMAVKASWNPPTD
jgi:hypothetical protein